MQIEETPTSTPSVSDDRVNYDEYFTNSVFVGDSVMEGFAQYVRAQRNSGVDMLSNAQFLTSLMGITVYDVVNYTTGAKCYFTYRGKETTSGNYITRNGCEPCIYNAGYE